jgi:hypothetical protein
LFRYREIVHLNNWTFLNLLSKKLRLPSDTLKKTYAAFLGGNFNFYYTVLAIGEIVIDKLRVKDFLVTNLPNGQSIIRFTLDGKSKLRLTGMITGKSKNQ